MRTTAIRKKALSLALALTLLTMGGISALAADKTVNSANGTVSSSAKLEASIAATAISVTHTATVGYAIDSHGAFTSSNISIVNNSTAPITVTLTKMNSLSTTQETFTPGVGTTSKQIYTSTLFDVAPTAKDWANLGVADSSKYISLGVTAAASSWSTGYSTNTYYASSGTTQMIGTLTSGKTGTLNLTSKHGNAFASAVTAGNTLEMSFSLLA